MPFTCEGDGSLWPDVAWRLALLAPRDIVSRACSNGPELKFRLRSRRVDLHIRFLWLAPVVRDGL